MGIGFRICYFSISFIFRSISSKRKHSFVYNYLNSYSVINRLILNIISGFVNAFIFPACSALLGRWAPPRDRTLLATMTYAGCALGIALGQPIAGVICDSSLSIIYYLYYIYIYIAWKGVYYLYCSFVVLFFIVYIMYVVYYCL